MPAATAIGARASTTARPSPTILIKHIYRHPVREAELRAAAEGRGVDTVDPRRDVDGDKAMEDFLCFFEE